MKDHIEAYLKQHYCRDYFNSYGETVEDDHYFMYREEVDGLIELIVRECMSLVSEPGPDMNDTERGILAQIKKHFGVEE